MAPFGDAFRYTSVLGDDREVALFFEGEIDYLKAQNGVARHASVTITMDVYAHVINRQKTDAADRIGATLYETTGTG